jgi:hypothetical protein
MKQFLILLLGLVAHMPLHGQTLTPVPDPDSTAEPGAHHYYYQNLGQLVDDQDNVLTDVQYYTDHASPSVYLGTNNISFVAHKPSLDETDTLVADTNFRIDMKFLCDSTNPEIVCGTIEAYDSSSDYLNYYLPHCSSGITDVHGFKGVVYKDAFVKTDVHFYSNQLGLKMYFVFHPGSIPEDLLLQFEGQDSISALASYLALYVSGHPLPLSSSAAYQVDTNSHLITPLGWLPNWLEMGNGKVQIQPGVYDPDQDLVVVVSEPTPAATAGVLGNIDWCTFYGASGGESSPAITSNIRNDLYHVMAHGGNNFPFDRGISLAQLFTGNRGKTDCYLTKFDSNQVRQWTTYYGGTDIDLPTSITNREGLGHGQIGNLFIGGRTMSRNLPLGATAYFQKTTYGGASAASHEGDGFIAGFNNSSGYLMYATYYGGSSRDEITALQIDPSGSDLYFCGYTHSTSWDSSSSNPDSSDFPIRRSNSNQFFQAGKVGNFSTSDAFIGRIYLTGGTLTWATYFGGENSDKFNHLAASNAIGSNEVYAVGVTASASSGGPYKAPTSAPQVPGALPLTDRSGTSDYFQYTTNNSFPPMPPAGTDGLIAHFESALKLDWCTFFGGDGSDGLTECAVNSTGDFYAVGYTVESVADSSNSQLANTGYKLPIYHDANSYWQYPVQVDPFTDEGDDLIIKFAPTTHMLNWSTCYGGQGLEGLSTSVNMLPISYQGAEQHIAIDGLDKVYFGSTTQIRKAITSTTTDDVPVLSVSGRYNQQHNASYGITTTYSSSQLDAYFVQFDKANTRKWATHFGGIQPNPNPPAIDTNNIEILGGIVAGGLSPYRLYVTGYTRNPTTPNQKLTVAGKVPYNQPLYGISSDVFIGRFIGAASVGVSSMPSVSASGNLIAAPNPSSTGLYNITFNTAQAGNERAKLLVLNILGQQISSQDISVKNGKNQYKLDISTSAPGVYMLELVSGSGSESTRIVKN